MGLDTVDPPLTPGGDPPSVVPTLHTLDCLNKTPDAYPRSHLRATTLLTPRSAPPRSTRETGSSRAVLGVVLRSRRTDGG